VEEKSKGGVCGKWAVGGRGFLVCNGRKRPGRVKKAMVKCVKGLSTRLIKAPCKNLRVKTINLSIYLFIFTYTIVQNLPMNL